MDKPETHTPAPEAKQTEPQNAFPYAAPPEEHFVSKGKKLHNELTYRGVDFLLNSTIGVAFTYWAARTHSGEKYFSAPINNFFQTTLKPVLKSQAARDEGAKWGTLLASIMAGGTTIIPPMMYLENPENKKSIIKWMDEKIYGEEVVKNDPKFQKSYDEIDCEPKKDFSTGMGARFLALAPIFAVTVMPEANKFFVKYMYNPIAKGSKAVAAKMGIQPKSLMERGRMELLEGDIKAKPQFLSDWNFIHRTIGFDFGLTFIYSFLHEGAYKALASSKAEKQETIGDCQAQPPPEKLELTPESEKNWTENVGQRKTKAEPTPSLYAEKLQQEPTSTSLGLSS